MATSQIRRSVNALRAERRAATKGIRPSLRRSGVLKRRRRTAKLHIRG